MIDVWANWAISERFGWFEGTWANLRRFGWPQLICGNPRSSSLVPRSSLLDSSEFLARPRSSSLVLAHSSLALAHLLSHGSFGPEVPSIGLFRRFSKLKSLNSCDTKNPGKMAQNPHITRMNERKCFNMHRIASITF